MTATSRFEEEMIAGWRKELLRKLRDRLGTDRLAAQALDVLTRHMAETAGEIHLVGSKMVSVGAVLEGASLFLQQIQGADHGEEGCEEGREEDREEVVEEAREEDRGPAFGGPASGSEAEAEEGGEEDPPGS